MQAATRVERVHLHGDGLDAGQARLRLGSLLQRAELRPPGLPPAAVLCVRQVLDPLPGVLQLETANARPPPDWERAFVESLERKLRGAARPAREAVPAAAEAVLFADRAELLACLARDVCDGTAWLRWWWRDMDVSPAAGRDRVVAAWLETPEHVPAALELLAARREAIPFVSALPVHAATALVLHVAAVHGLLELGRIATGPISPAPTDRRPPVDGGAPPPEPPWRKRVPESTERQLAPHAELLLGVSLVLRREPQRARSPTFAAATRVWLAATAHAQAERSLVPAAPRKLPNEATPIAESMPPQPTPDRAPAMRDSEFAPEQVRATPPTEPESTQAPTPEPAATATVAAAPVGPSAVVPATAAPQRVTETPPRASSLETPASPHDERPQPLPAVMSETPRTRVRTKRARRVPTPTPLVLSEPPPALLELVVETQLGGVFYLLNLALFLDLYVDFTRPRERGLALDPWDLLALLAPRLLDEPSRDDALWPLLAQLASRSPRERPGRRFRPPRAWRTPPKWLAPFDHDETWRWSAARDALRLVHPEGFAVAAVPRTRASPRAQLERELRRLRPLAPKLQRTTLPVEPAQPLARWTNRLAAYADARLRLALGRNDSLDALLLRHRARVFITPTHVDVALRLADLPLEVRFAGLDRTPGWIPAAGRFVTFHFE
jgi:hypothetical protein